MINSRHTGMIIWIIKILRRLHDTFYKQNVLSLAFRQRVGIIYQNDEYIMVSPCYIKDKELVINTSYQYRTKIIGIKKHIVHFGKMTVKTQDDLDNYICK